MLQRDLVQNALTLLSHENPRAEIWYMTCSILAEENQVGRGIL